jgi:thioesterase domain-containing protein
MNSFTATSTPGIVDGDLLVPVKTTPLGRRSVLLHAAGGGLGPYVGVGLKLSKLGSVYGVRAAGLYPGEWPDETVVAMARRYRALLDQLDGPPDVLFGWSLGGVLAWELAAGYAAAGHHPRVIMIDSPAVATAGDPGALRRWRERVDRFAGPVPDGHDPDLAARTVHAHLAAVTAHEVTAAHGCPTLLMPCAEEDNEAHLARWREVAADLTVRPLPCGHFDALSRPHLATVLDHVREFLR